MKKRFRNLLLAVLCIVSMLHMLAMAADSQPQADPFAFRDRSIPEDTPITRAQVAALAVRALDAKEQADLQGYSDVPADAWYRQEMACAVEAGLFIGYQHQLRPEDPITRQEAGLVFSRLLSTDEKDEKLAALVGNQPREPLSRGDFLRLANSLLPQSLEAGAQGWQLEGSTLITQPGTYRQLTVEGDLILSEGAQTGQTILQDALVSGRILIRGGGSVRLQGRVQAQQIEVAPGSSHLRLDCQTQQPQSVVVRGNLTYLDGDFATISLDCPEGTTMLVGTAQAVSLPAKNSCFQALPGCQVAFADIRGDGCTILGQGQVGQAVISASNVHIDTPETSILALPGSNQVWANGELVQSGLTQAAAPAKQPAQSSYTPSFFPASSTPSQPDQPDQPELPPISAPAADSVALDASLSAAGISALEKSEEGEVLVLQLAMESLLDGQLPDGLESYFQHEHPGSFSTVALHFPKPADLQPGQQVLLTYTSAAMRAMGYGPEDSTDSITYQLENRFVQVEQRFSAEELEDGVLLILPFDGQEEQAEIRLRWGEDLPELRYRLEIPAVSFQLLSQPEVILIAGENGPALQLVYQRSAPAEQSAISVGLEGQEPLFTLEPEDLQAEQVQAVVPLSLENQSILLDENWEVTVEETFQGQPQTLQWQGRFPASQWAAVLPTETDCPYEADSAYIDPLTPEEEEIQHLLDTMWQDGDGDYANLIRFEKSKNLILVDISKTEGLSDWCQANFGRPDLPILLASAPLFPGVEVIEEWGETAVFWLEASLFDHPNLTRLSADDLPPLYLLFYNGQAEPDLGF